ncbi:hypothetical protein [Chryseobacterium sediminis]|nr:hypothetical protein [Chryseobacterium sediminis]MDR6465110.1 hypothetical protein [Chryseobacterium sediminis]
MEKKENKIQILKKAIQEGMESGIAADFNPEKHLTALKAKIKR